VAYNNPNLSDLDKLGVPVTPFEIITTAIGLADMVYKIGLILLDEKVQIVQPEDGKDIQLNIGEAGNLFLRINFQRPKIDLKRIFNAVKLRGTKRKSGVIIELDKNKIFPYDETDGKGNPVDANTFLVDTKEGVYETLPTRIPVIAAGGSAGADSGSPYKLKILAFNKRVKTSKNSSWEYVEESDAATINLWIRNPFSIQSFMKNEKADEDLSHGRNVEETVIKLRIGYDRGNSNDLSISGLKTCHCNFRISCSSPVINPRIQIEPLHSADIGDIGVEGSSITVNAKNLALESSKFFVFTIINHHGEITDKPIEGIKEFSLEKAQVNGVTEAKGQRGDMEYPVKRKWSIPIQFPAAVSTRIKI
jgi:hypothetical protein